MRFIAILGLCGSLGCASPPPVLWYWENPTPTGDYLWGVDGRTPDDLYAVGELGLVMHYDGASWTAVYDRVGWEADNPGIGPPDLRDVWIDSSGTLVAVGNRDALHFDGTNWKVHTLTPTGFVGQLRGVSGTGPSSIYAIWGGGEIHRFDGSSWSVDASGLGPLSEIFSLASGEVWAGGAELYQLVPDGAGALVWAIRDDLPSSTKGITALWAANVNDLFVAREDEIVHWNGANWTSTAVAAPGPYKSIVALWGRSGSDVFALTNAWQLYHYDGTGWSLQQPVPQAWPAARRAGGGQVLGGAGSRIVAVLGYLIFSHDLAGDQAGQWVRETQDIMTPPGGPVHPEVIQELAPLADDDVWFGGDGAVFRYDGDDVTVLSTGRGKPVKDVLPLSDGSAYANEDGVLLRYDASGSWSQVPSISGVRDIWGTSADDVWVASGSRLWHYAGGGATGWVDVPDAVADEFVEVNRVWGSSAWDVFVSGDRYPPGSPREMYVAHYDGFGWTDVSPSGPWKSEVIWAGFSRDSTETWVATPAAGALRLRQGVWTHMGGPSWALDVYIDEMGDVYVAAGSVFRFDGSAWHEERSEHGMGVGQITGATPGRLLASSGFRSSILTRVPGAEDDDDFVCMNRLKRPELYFRPPKIDIGCMVIDCPKPMPPGPLPFDLEIEFRSRGIDAVKLTHEVKGKTIPFPRSIQVSGNAELAEDGSLTLRPGRSKIGALPFNPRELKDEPGLEVSIPLVDVLEARGDLRGADAARWRANKQRGLAEVRLGIDLRYRNLLLAEYFERTQFGFCLDSIGQGVKQPTELPSPPTIVFTDHQGSAPQIKRTDLSGSSVVPLSDPAIAHEATAWGTYGLTARRGGPSLVLLDRDGALLGSITGLKGSHTGRIHPTLPLVVWAQDDGLWFRYLGSVRAQLTDAPNGFTDDGRVTFAWDAYGDPVVIFSRCEDSTGQCVLHISTFPIVNPFTNQYTAPLVGGEYLAVGGTSFLPQPGFAAIMPVRRGDLLAFVAVDLATGEEEIHVWKGGLPLHTIDLAPGQPPVTGLDIGGLEEQRIYVGYASSSDPGFVVEMTLDGSARRVITDSLGRQGQPVVMHSE